MIIRAIVQVWHLVLTAASIAMLMSVVLSSCGLPRNPDNSSPNIKVQFINAKTGWIAGPRILRTGNGGLNWEIVNSTGPSGKVRHDLAEDGLKRIQFITSQIGWVLGDNEKKGKIIKTVDGGQTWPYELNLPLNREDTYIRPTFFFVTDDIGWYVSSKIYRTYDGGSTWRMLCQTPGVAPGGPAGVPWFISSKEGFLGARDKGIYRTLDGGETWALAHQASSYIYDIFFYNYGYGWAVGSDGFIVRTVDGGLRWEKCQVPTVPHLYSVFFITSQLGWAVGRHGTAVKEESNVLRSTDGGATWRESVVEGFSFPLPPLVSVSFTDSLHGWAVGGADKYLPSGPRNLIISTVDGGVTWRNASLNISVSH
jgi:photosystem II stability/assembly factor-like uncharacterized protein